MADDTPSVAKSDYPSFTGYPYDDVWDQGTKGAPNSQYVDGWWLSQIQSEILKHQQLLQAGAAQLFAPELMGTPGSNPAVISELVNGMAIMTFVDAATTSILVNAQVLSTSTDVIIVWSATPTTGNVRWKVAWLDTDDDDDMAVIPGPGNTVYATAAVSAVADGQVKTTLSMTGLTVGNTLLLKIDRLGADALDTLTATANVALVKLETA